MPFCLQCKDLFKEFYAMLKDDITKALSNERMAQLNRLAYSDSLQKSLLKKIAKRVGKNADMLDTIDSKINELLKTMDFKQIAEEYKDDSEKYGHCIISYKDWFDALQDGDCFCLTFDAQRPESGIMDPTMVTIKTINATQLTAESFLDSALFITRAGQVIKGEGKHGASAATLIQGLPDEIITGVMPLYINAAHWKVARLRMAPLLAWSVAQDVLAYEQKQLITLPFLLLAKAAIDRTTEHKQFQFKIILDTCVAIYKESNKFILPYLNTKLETYIAQPDVRTLDIIPNNRLILIHFYIATQLGDIDAKLILPILPYLMEEELRRCGPKAEDDIHAFNKEMLGVDIAKYVTPHVLAFKEQIEAKDKSDISAGGKFKELLKSQNPEFNFEGEEVKAPGKIEEMKDVLQEELKIECEFKELPERAKKAIANYNSILNDKKMTAMDTAKLLEFFGITAYKEVNEMGLDTPMKQLTFAIQNLTQKVNSVRREAIQKGIYVNPFDQAIAQQFINKLYLDTVVLERNNQKSSYIAEREKGAGSINASKFASSKDVFEAAGLLHGKLRGSAIFHAFHSSLRVPGCPLVIEKVKMLTSGQYLGVRLIMDKMKNESQDLVNGFVSWKPIQKHAYKIWKPNREQGTLEQWKEAFPTLVEYLDDQEKRIKGEFVPYKKPKSNVNDPRHRSGKVGYSQP